MKISDHHDDDCTADKAKTTDEGYFQKHQLEDDYYSQNM